MMGQENNDISSNNNNIIHVLLDCDKGILKRKMFLLCNEAVTKHVWKWSMPNSSLKLMF